MPIIATRASAAYGAGFAAITAAPFVLEGSYDALASVTLNASVYGGISFVAIPSGYKHLQIRQMSLTTADLVQPQMRFNSDGGNNYSRHSLYSAGSSAGVYGAASVGNLVVGGLNTGNNTTNPYVCVIDIYDYDSTTKYKTMTSLSGTDRNGTGEIGFHTGVWLNTAAITSVTMDCGGTYAANSSFALYGVK
jgi:hypothetical protein